MLMKYLSCSRRWDGTFILEHVGEIMVDTYINVIVIVDVRHLSRLHVLR